MTEVGIKVSLFSRRVRVKRKKALIYFYFLLINAAQSRALLNGSRNSIKTRFRPTKFRKTIHTYRKRIYLAVRISLHNLYSVIM